jgi:hypothetical protein
MNAFTGTEIDLRNTCSGLPGLTVADAESKLATWTDLAPGRAQKLRSAGFQQGLQHQPGASALCVAGRGSAAPPRPSAGPRRRGAQAKHAGRPAAEPP